MANNTISQVEINGTTYDLLDANTLSALDSLKTRVTTLESSVVKKNALDVSDTEFSHSYMTNNFWFKWDSPHDNSRNSLTFYNSGDVLYQNNDNTVWKNTNTTLTPWKTPAYTTVSGVTIHTVVWTRIGHIVILNMQVSLPSVSNSSILITFSDIPAPLRGDNFFTVGNGDKSRALTLQASKILRAAGTITEAIWLSGTCIYTTDELI